MPSGQPALLEKSSKCLEILTKIRLRYAIGAASLASKIFKMPTPVSTRPQAFERLFKHGNYIVFLWLLRPNLSKTLVKHNRFKEILAFPMCFCRTSCWTCYIYLVLL